jgi:uncharacterized hydrophobic protein (TIGR00271 family)
LGVQDDQDLPMNPEQQERSEMKESSKNFIRVLLRYFRRVTDIKSGTDEDSTIDGIIRDIEFKGPNLWILALSILIASIGLNTNSTAIIIGAMLISPLMGPILGVGLSVGINDFTLLKKSGRNLLNAVGISIVASSLYFFLSPLDDAQSELLARTNPTLLDVLIATFGGFAGIIAGSRKEKSNVVPGVAIATALMPPLCTAGYGLGTLQWEFFFGALYLFFINAVFIGLSTFLIVRYLGFHKRSFMDPAKERKVRLYIGIFVLITVVPSIYIGYNVVRQSIFNARATSFISENMVYDNVEVINTKFLYDTEPPRVEMTCIGEILTEQQIEELRRKLPNYNLAGAELRVHQSVDATSRIAEKLNRDLRIGIIEDLYKKNEENLASKEEQIRVLEAEIVRLKSMDFPVDQLLREVQSLYPEVLEFSMTTAIRADSLGADTIPLAVVRWNEMAEGDGEKLRSWLAVRLDQAKLDIVNY